MIAEVDIGLKRPATFPLTKLDKLLVVIGEVNMGTRPATLPPINQATMVDCCVYLVLLVILMIVFIKTKYVIVGVILQDVEVGLKRSATLHFTTM